MKPATSLCSLRIVTGTRRSTNVSPPTATRQAPQTTTMPYITLIGGGLFPPFSRVEIAGGTQDTSPRVYKQIGCACVSQEEDRTYCTLAERGGCPRMRLPRSSVNNPFSPYTKNDRFRYRTPVPNAPYLYLGRPGTYPG